MIAKLRYKITRIILSVDSLFPSRILGPLLSLFHRKKQEVETVEIARGENKGFKYQIISYEPEVSTQKLANFQVYQSTPHHRSIKNVIYNPIPRGLGPDKYGGLYSDNAELIEDSCIFRNQGRSTRLTQSPDNIIVPMDIEVDNKPYVYAGSNIAHYGHFLTESLSRLWYIVKNNNTDSYILFHGYKQELDIGYIDTFFKLLGISKDRLVIHDKAKLLSNVTIPYPSWSDSAEIFEIHKLSHELVAQKVIHRIKINKTSQPLYLSRLNLSHGNRQIAGEQRLVEYFTKKGSKVVDPQNLDLKEQIILFNEHETIIGIQGSALHNVLFSLQPKNMFYMCQKAGGANYLMIDMIKGNSSNFIRCMVPSLLQNLEEGFKKTSLIDADLVIKYFDGLDIF